MSGLRKMKAAEFARRLKSLVQEQDKHFAFFIGAGCSVSSGIPAAGPLVRDQWLARLRDFRAPRRRDLEAWAVEGLGYDPEMPSASYGKVIEELFLESEDRQREIERLCEGRFPGFGYAVLAGLIAQEGGRFNVVLTTNFDDMVPDALYLFTEARPLVVPHEALAAYIRPTRTRPLVVKVHGDHHLSPYNTEDETEKVSPQLERAIGNLLHDRGLIFMGYGGADEGIRRMLESLPSTALPLGVFWVGQSEPEGVLRPWLEKRNAHWIEKGDFDEMMLLVRDAFGLPAPDRQRFDDVFNNYFETYGALSKNVEALPESTPEVAALKSAVKSTDKTFTDWRAVELEARRVKETDPDAADAIYAEGIRRFPDSAPLKGNYAIFLEVTRKDYDRAEKYYEKAVEADSNDADYLGNYAGMLLATGRARGGAEMLGRAMALLPEVGNPTLTAECWFYVLAHLPSERHTEAIRQLKHALMEGARSPGWDLSANVARAREDGHPYADWLEKLASVISDGADISILDEWLEWRKAATPEEAG